MRCLIRYITRRGKGGSIYRDEEFSGKNILLGRAADQTIFFSDLRVSLQHALITDLPGGRFLIQSKAISGIRVNGRLSQSTSFRAGDLIGIGSSEIKVVQTPPGFDLALEVDVVREHWDPGKRLKKALAEISPRTASLRAWSWIFFVGILLLFLGVPAANLYLGDYYQPYTEKIEEMLSSEEDDEYYELPEMPWLISDRFWNSGELAYAHYFFREECDTCHQQAFVPVPDSACINCHKKTHPHVDPDFFDLDILTGTRCAECHKDHNGRHALIRKDDTLCSNCHKDLTEESVLTELGDAADFGTEHPEFIPSLVSFKDGEEVSRRVKMDDEENFREESNLKFPHDVHLAKGGLATFDGIFHLWCDDCHIHETGKPHMQPINFEIMCQNCHRLSFEPSEPSRQVPHGKLSEVMFTLEEYYANLALKGGYADMDVPEVVREERFPDEEPEGEERMIALNWARDKAEEIGEELFEFSVCIECHEVEQISMSPSRWTVMPVRINQNWLPKAIYTHEQHKTIKCLFCHAAPESETSADILLPTLDMCRQCHGGVNASGKLQSTCVDCHGFHVAKEFSMTKE
ncbi:MAG: FHA domain-containing protein [Gammaproteobacteria bacterium]|nr:FHA domain-containing protein [Gammaproteobacteria bacterium]